MTSTANAPAALELHPDRLLPADPTARAVARRLYQAVRDLPIVSPHGHIDPVILRDDVPFTDPAQLFVTPDHYVTRLLHASGVPLPALGVGQGPLSEAAAREAWRLLCTHWSVFRGTPVRYWLESELSEIFGVAVRPSAATADTIYDHLAERLALPEFRPRALYDRFRIEALSTTDDPCSDLSVHAALTADPTWHGRVLPTFRPDRHLEASEPGWPAAVAELSQVSGIDTSTYAGWVEAIEDRRAVLPAARGDRRGPRARGRRHRAARRRPGRGRLPSGDGRDRQPRPGGRPAPPHAARDGADVHRGRPDDDAAHGRASRSPPAVAGRVRTGHRPRHPDQGRVHRLAAPAARALRHAPQPARWCSSRSTRRRSRGSSLRSPGSTRRSTSECRGGSSTHRTPSGAGARRSPRRSASAAPPASSTTPGRTARSRHATTCPGVWTAGTSPDSWWSTGWTRTRPSRPRWTSSAARSQEVFQL